MAFVDYEFFTTLYGADAIDSVTFNRVVWNAEKAIKNATTGVDGFSKLDKAFPTVDDDIQTIKRCVCALVDLISKIEKANTDADNGKVVESVSAGNERITYSIGGGIIGSVLSDKKAQEKLLNDTVNEYLRGIKDNNGVNLLYLGIYPYLINY